jgi:GAF domain-containing protein
VGFDMAEILPSVLRVASDELQAATGSIIVVDDADIVQHAWLIDNGGSEESSSPFLQEVVERGLFAWATRLQQTLVVDDTRHDERWLPRSGTSHGHRALVGRLHAADRPGRPTGAITMTRKGANQFGQREVELLEAIAGHAATTIESARLYQESQQRAEVLSALVAAAAVVSTSLEPEQVLRVLAEQMTRLLHVDLCLIYDWDEAGQRLTPRLPFLDGR